MGQILDLKMNKGKGYYSDDFHVEGIDLKAQVLEQYFIKRKHLHSWYSEIDSTDMAAHLTH
jgi:hypothetical protein